METNDTAMRAWSARQKAGATKYFPFGEEIRRTAGTAAKFGGYVRDDASGLDYAEQRYYSSSLGRFMTPDPFERSAHVKSPNSWNRYAFVNNDPINRVDPHGLNDGSTPAGTILASGATIDSSGDTATMTETAESGGTAQITITVTASATDGSSIQPELSQIDATLTLDTTNSTTGDISFSLCMTGALINNFLGNDEQAGVTTIVNGVAILVLKQAAPSILPGPGWVYTGTALLWDAAMIGKSYASCTATGVFEDESGN